MTWPFGRCGRVGYLYNGVVVFVVFVAATALLLVVVGTIAPSGLRTTMARRWCLRHLEIHSLSPKRGTMPLRPSSFQHGHRVWLIDVEDCWSKWESAGVWEYDTTPFPSQNPPKKENAQKVD